MAGAISESEMRRRTENVGLSVQSVRLEGGDVTKAFMHDAGEYTRGDHRQRRASFPAPVVVTDWSDDGACSRPVSDVFRQIKSACRDTVSLYWISLFLWFDYATSPTKRYRPYRPNFY